MANRWTSHDDRQLGELLSAAGGPDAFPPTPDLASSVRDRIQPRRPIWYRRFWASMREHPAVAASVAAVLLVVVSTGLFTPVPGAVADRLGVRGIEISFGPLGTSPAPIGSDLALGERVTLAEARSSVPYQLSVPAHPELGDPDEVYVGDLGEVRQVSLVYGDRAGFPTAQDDIGLLVTQFPARLERPAIVKGLPDGTTLEHVSVKGRSGFWLSGEPHRFTYRSRNDGVAQERVRLAANVLLWETDEAVYRIEGALSKDDALAIAESMEVK